MKFIFCSSFHFSILGLRIEIWTKIMDYSANSSQLPARNLLEQEETSVLMETSPTAQEWTDEQHCLFLKSMESRFVNQLYKSIDLSGWQSRKSSPANSKSFKHKQMSTRTSSGQFKVLRNGLWSKVDFRGDESEEQKEEFKVHFSNPWIQHYRNSKTQSSRKHRASCAKVTTEYQDSVDKNAEGEDQNFNDEVLEEDKSGTIHNPKGSRTSDIVSSNDQIVPYDDDIVRGDNVIHIPPKS